MFKKLLSLSKTFPFALHETKEKIISISNSHYIKEGEQKG
jgi:hypothetical protein